MKQPEANANPAIRLESVTKTYLVGEPVHAVKELSLDIPRGSFMAVMGPSGSGKSTLMNLIGCLDTPTSGRLIVNGQDVTQLSDRQRTTLRGKEIGFVFQSFNLMPKLSVLDNVALPMTFLGISGKERVARARDLLERMGMSDKLQHKPSQLSGGQRQRVAIARALANEPTLVLADEPTGNLDSKTGGDVITLFNELHSRGYTILLVTHERHIAEHAESIIHVADGEIREVEVLRREEVIA